MSDLVGKPIDLFLSRRGLYVSDYMVRKIHNVRKRRKVHVGNDQEKAQSERDFHSKNRGGKN